MKPSKFQIFQKSLKIVKNWYMIPLIYYGFVKSEYCVLNLKSGHKIKIRVKSTDLQVFTNVWLNEEYKFSGFNINDNDTIIDIGAHIGLFAIFASQFSKGGKILSFEPVSSNYKLLLENIELNKISIAHLFNLAVYNKQKEIKIFLNDDDAGHSIIRASLNFEIVKTVSLMKIMEMNNINVCNYLKLDCEGAEFEILEELPDSFFSRIEKIVMEYHIFENNIESLMQLKNRLNRLNFKIIDKPYSNKLGMLYVKK